MATAVVIVDGDPPGPSVLDELPDDPWVVAVDGGLDHATRLGLTVDRVVGDMDSVSPEGLATIDPSRLDPYPTDKDATDLELAMNAAAAVAERVIVVGGTGGRLDHLIGNVTILCSDRYAAVDIEWVSNSGRAFVVRSHVDLHGVPGQIVSLLPMGGDAAGVTTAGLRWPLEDARLRFGTSRGVSNEFTSPVARVSLRSGVLLVVQPDLT